MSNADSGSDSDDLLPPSKTMKGGYQGAKRLVKRRRSLISEDEMDLIDTGYLKDTRKINDQLIQHALEKQATPVVDTRAMVTLEELNNNGAHKEFKESDEEVENILKHGAPRFLFVYRDLKLEPPEQNSSSEQWWSSLDGAVLKNHIRRRKTKTFVPIGETFDIGMIKGFQPVLKYNHYNSTSEVNILRTTIFILDKLQYGPVDDGLYDIFCWTLCDYNLNRYCHELLVEFSKFFTQIYAKCPKNIGDVVNSWKLKYYYETNESDNPRSDLKHIKYELWYHILNILNLHPSPETKISIIYFIDVTDLRDFFTLKPSLETVHKTHMDLRLLPFVLTHKDINTNDIFKLKKKYQELMSRVTFGDKSNETKQDLLKMLHEDYLYLNYYEIKFKQYQDPTTSYDY